MLAYFILLATTAWAGAMSSRNTIRYAIFYVPTVLIVGLKYEVGFDWNVYSSQFAAFSQIPLDRFFYYFTDYVTLYAHEPLFILLSYLGSQLFGTFELFYCVCYLFFIFSITRLGRVLESNYIAAFAIIHLFLLFTLEFSTLRQLIALSLVNLGIAFSIERQRWKGIVFFTIAPFFQGSAAIYVFVFLILISTKQYSKIILSAGFLLAILVSAIGISDFARLFSFALPLSLSAKLEYYTQIREYNFSIAEYLFSITLYLILILFGIKNRKSQNGNIRLLSNFLLFLVAISLAGFAIPTLRNRMLYEIVTIASLLLFANEASKKAVFRLAIIPMGIFFFAVSLTKQTSFMFVPYQNYVWHLMWGLESDGWDRQDRLKWLLRNG